MLRRRLDALQVAEHGDPGLAVVAHRVTVEHADHARRGARLREIELQDLRVRMRAAQEHDVREPREAEIVDELAATLQEALGVGARLGFADVARLRARRRFLDRRFLHLAHRVPACRLAISTASTASTMAW